jgi:transposase-like protein
MVAGNFIQQVGATRQRRSIAKKHKIVEQTMQPGASVTRVAQQHGVKAHQVFYWRNLYRQGRLDEERTASISLLPVQVAEATASKSVELEAKRNPANHRGPDLRRLSSSPSTHRRPCRRLSPTGGPGV